MEKKKLLGINMIATLYLLMGMLGIIRQFSHPNFMVASGATSILILSQFLFKHNSIAVRLACRVSIAFVGVGITILAFYFIALFSATRYSDDYLIGVTGAGLVIWGIATSFYMTRPKVKEQFMVLEAVKSEQELVDKSLLTFSEYIFSIKKRIGLLSSLYNFRAPPFFIIIWLLFYIFCVPILFII